MWLSDHKYGKTLIVVIYKRHVLVHKCQRVFHNETFGAVDIVRLVCNYISSRICEHG